MTALLRRILIVALAFALPAIAIADEWPQWRGPNRDDVWRETGIIDKFPVEQSTPAAQLPLAWRVPISSGYCGPTVAGGRVYVMDRVIEPKEIERILAFDAATGKPVWSHSYDCEYQVMYPAGPRASVSIDEGRAYALGTMGHLHCCDATDGRVLWRKDLGPEYKIRLPIWGVSACPLIDGDLLITQIGGIDNACVVAFDKHTGTERWRALSDNASYSAPIIIEQAGRRVLVVWTGDNVVGLNPASGEVYWKHPLPPLHKVIIGVATPVVTRDRLFVTSFYEGSLMLKLLTDRPAVELAWYRHGVDEQHTDALHSIIATPYFDGDYVYGVDSYGELRCLDAKTGDRVWESRAAVPRERWATIHMVRNGDRMWMFNDRGELIISKLSPQGFEEISRAKLLDPTTDQLRRRDGVCWSHPAYANRHIFARNDKELVCASLAAE